MAWFPNHRDGIDLSCQLPIARVDAATERSSQSNQSVAKRMSQDFSSSSDFRLFAQEYQMISDVTVLPLNPMVLEHA